MDFKSALEFKEEYGFMPFDDSEMDENAVTTTKEIAITFIKADQSSYILHIPDFKESVTDEQIAAAANVILDKGIFNPGGFDLVRLDKAEKIVKTRTGVILG